MLFPLHDLRGRAVGFGGRLIGPGEPKYLNSPETPIFHKGDQLYHMHLARNAIRRADYAIVVEGYFDVQRLALVGVEQVVAPLGTALTEQQATLLKRYTNEVVLLFDSDAPGLKATFRSADTLLAHGVRVRVATMPPGEDPDTLAREGGAAAIEAVVRDAVDVLERKLQLLEMKGWFADVHRAREALDRLLPTLRAAADPVTRELYVSRVAERLGIPREAVTDEAARRAPAPPMTSVPQPTHRHESPPHRREADGGIPRTPGAEIERKLLRLLLRDPAWLRRATGEVAPDRFAVPTFRRIYEALLALPEDAPVGDALAALDEQARDAWQRLLGGGPPGEGFDADREYTGALETLEEIHDFPDIAAERDPMTMRRRWQALSKEGQHRFQLYLATMRRSAPRPAEPPFEE